MRLNLVCVYRWFLAGKTFPDHQVRPMKTSESHMSGKVGAISCVQHLKVLRE